ncbi:MAG: fasciclin domain-containing protein [Thermodesulfobacteriota bacterium]
MKVKTAILTLCIMLIPVGLLMAQPPMNIYETLKANGNFKTLISAIDKANVAETKQMPGPFTIFAPDDVAFNKMPPQTLKNIMDDPAILRNVVFFHIVPGKYMAKDLPELKECKSLCPTAAAKPLTFTKVGTDKYMVNDANITKPDMMATNGVIQVIDKVLVPTMAPPKVP